MAAHVLNLCEATPTPLTRIRAFSGVYSLVLAQIGMPKKSLLTRHTLVLLKLQFSIRNSVERRVPGLGYRRISTAIRRQEGMWRCGWHWHLLCIWKEIRFYYCNFQQSSKWNYWRITNRWDSELINIRRVRPAKAKLSRLIQAVTRLRFYCRFLQLEWLSILAAKID